MTINLDFLNKINEKNKYLIDYANLQSSILFPQTSFFSKTLFNEYKKNKYLGIPSLLPANLSCFNYNESDRKFLLSKKSVNELIFDLEKLNYVGIKRTLNSGKYFISNGVPKKKYKNLVSKIIHFNKIQKNKIIRLKRKHKSICAFQTRNYPHLGHETIINFLLTKSNIVVINPIIGPKKKGDVNFDNLIKSYNYLIRKKYNNRVKFIPIIANMHYAGPREACHHAIIRKNLGFTDFLVGRDHAGADNVYQPRTASLITSHYQDTFGLNIISIDGAYFCKKCQKTVILNQCNHNKKYMVNISGSDFRNCLSKKKIYKFADISFQKYFFKYLKKI